MSKLINDFINKSGTEIKGDLEERYVPLLVGGGMDSEEGRFVIGGKVVQGTPSKDNSMLHFVKRAFSKGYSKEVETCEEP